MEACVGAHHLSRQLLALGHDARIMPAQYVRPYLRGQKNDYHDGEAITEAVQRPRMRFVPTKSVEQLDLQSMHRVRSRLVRHRTSVINQLRALLLDRGIAVRQGARFLPAVLPEIHGQRVILLSAKNWHKHRFGAWLEAASKRMHRNVLAVALANKLARIARSVLASKHNYQAQA